MQTLYFPPDSFPVLETPRLRLRELVMADAPAVFDLFANPEVTRYYDFEAFTSQEQAADLIARQRSRFRTGEGLRWGLTQKEADRVIGTVGLYLDRTNAQGRLGYDLARPYWRRGLMSEALHIVLRYAFLSVGVNRLQALVMPSNEASAGLLLKLGFTDEGTLREYQFIKGRYQDLRCFSLLRREYRQRGPTRSGNGASAP